VDWLLIGLIALAAGGAGYVLLSGSRADKDKQRRLREVRLRHSDAAIDRVEAHYRKAVAARRPAQQPTAGAGSRREALALRLHRTGRGWSVRDYLVASAAIAGSIALFAFLQTGAEMLSLGLGVLAGTGIPHLAVSVLINRRGGAFTTRFPDAIDLLVRGLRSGLPVTETIGIVASEVPGPVGEEFKLISERMRIGRTMDDALQETADRLDTAEFRFFVIALAIQRETGGNLAETLSNLGDVLRKRAQMKLKVRAMSSESKASAYIVGALPFIVFTMIWWINPKYIGAFFTDERLIVTGLGGLVWMAIGGFIMAKMVSFEI
jgi:tight adherence protein B